MKTEIKCLTKQIIYIIIVLMLCNFIIPNYSYAVETEEGGSYMEAIAQFLCFVPDAVNNLLQNMFVTPNNIQVLNGIYEISYSPGVIFSGTVPAFNVNFINPMPKKEIPPKTSRVISLDDISTGEIGNVFDRLKNNEECRLESDGYYTISHFADSLDNEYEKINNKYNYNVRDYEGTIAYGVINYDEWYGDSWFAGIMDFFLGNRTKSNFFWICDNTIYFMVSYIMDYMLWYDFAYSIFSTTLTEAELQAFKDKTYVYTSDTPEYYESSSAILQPVVSTWYNVLRRIALVGLLSVLVYIGIRILLTSTSAKDKAKYKNMLKDWLVALCLLFTLHYIMNTTIIVVDKINEIFEGSVIGENGADVLMTSVRNEIANSENWSTAITYVVIYFVLTIYTVIFTIQYLRRMIYLAFLTMIAPLITLTYPLDKIKDSKSQAFDKWLKDYMFFTLIQIVHLLIYYIFLGSAIDLNKTGNWLYAIVAIGFIMPAEKLIKKMFGFEKSKTLGAMGAGATGALVMNAIQKIPQGGGSKGGNPEKQASSEGKTTSTVRTAGANPFVNYAEGNPADISEMPKNLSTPGTESSQKSTKGLSKLSSKKPKRSIYNGVKAVAKRYVPTAARGSIRFMAGTTGAIIGFSSGVAQGDVGKAISGLTVGATAGSSVANMTMNTVKMIEQIPEKVDDIVDTYREGAYGKEVAQNAKFDRVFRNSREYTDLRDSSGFSEKEFNQKVQKILDSGIQDPKQMKKILQNHKKHPRKYNMDDAIRYSKLAKKCTEDVLYDRVKFIRFCEDRKLHLSEEELNELRKNIINFK